jgi:hypothetical protein
MIYTILHLWYHTRVKLDTVTEELETKTGKDLAAYFLPANATMYPPAEAYNIQRILVIYTCMI